MHVCTSAHTLHTSFPIISKDTVSIRRPDFNIKQIASIQVRKIKRKAKLSLQRLPLTVPESLSTPPSRQWSPNCLKAVQYISEKEKDDPTKQNTVCTQECGKLATSVRMEHSISTISTRTAGFGNTLLTAIHWPNACLFCPEFLEKPTQLHADHQQLS